MSLFLDLPDAILNTSERLSVLHYVLSPDCRALRLQRYNNIAERRKLLHKNRRFVHHFSSVFAHSMGVCAVCSGDFGVWKRGKK